MAFNIGCKNGLNGHWKNSTQTIQGDMDFGVGVPTYSAPIGTVYSRTESTVGTNSHYRNTNGAGTWQAMAN